MSSLSERVWESVAQAGGGADADPDRLGFLLEAVRPGSRVLDLGCGNGSYAVELAGVATSVTAADVAPTALMLAAKRAPDAELVQLDGSGELPFANSSFDLVWLAETLEHVADVEQLMSEVRRVLVADGAVRATTPANGWLSRVTSAALRFDSYFDVRSDHLRFFTARSVRELFQAFDFDEVQVASVGGAPLARRELRISAVRPRTAVAVTS